MLSTIFAGVKQLVHFENLRKYFSLVKRPNFLTLVEFFLKKIVDNIDPGKRGSRQNFDDIF